jgi:hypothetical protein
VPRVTLASYIGDQLMTPAPATPTTAVPAATST